jgi:hypothetical protein
VNELIVLHRHLLSARPGASLALALCVLVVIECVILGTFHLALLERQLAHNSSAALRLRLAADATLAFAAASWDEAAEDAIANHRSSTLWRGEPAQGISGVAVLHPVGGHAALLRAEVREDPPAAGVASAAALLLPPLLPPAFRPGQDLSDVAADSLLERLLHGLSTGPPAPGVLVLDDDSFIDDVVSGVVASMGDLRLAPGARVNGMVFVAGTLTIDSGAILTGAAVARHLSVGQGALVPDAEAAGTAVSAAGLRMPRPARGRSRIPAF